MISVVNSVFEYPQAQADPEFRAVKRALVYLAIAAARRGVQEQGDAHGCSIVERARMVIASEAEDPDFTVNRLAQTLGVSTTVLNGDFQTAGSRPSCRS